MGHHFRTSRDPCSARNSDPKNFDAKLSKKGISQVEKLAANDEVRGFAPGLVVSSPHFRALQTAVALQPIFNPSATQKKQVVVSALLRETPRTTVPPPWVGEPQPQECRGRLKAVLQKDPYFKHQRFVNWRTLKNGAWWSETIVSTDDTRQEAADFRTWLQKRRERKIAVIGHIGKLGNMVKKKPANIWPRNCQPYFCVLRKASKVSGPTLHYAGKTEAAAKKKQGQNDKLVLLLRHGKSQAQNHEWKPKEEGLQKHSSKNGRVKKTFLKKKANLGGLPEGAVIRRTGKHAKRYIVARCNKVAGSTVGKILASSISYTRDGKSLTYGLTDLRYDLRCGYLKCYGPYGRGKR